jgi:hypothetical protein
MLTKHGAAIAQVRVSTPTDIPTLIWLKINSPHGEIVIGCALESEPNTPPTMPRIEKVQHILRITSWNFDYGFGLNRLKAIREAYSDFRHLELGVSILKPAGLKATVGQVVLFPDQSFAESSSLRRSLPDWAREGKTPERSQKLRPVGHVSYRGKDYSANLHMPPDALPLVLQMLAAAKYHFLIFEAAKGGRDADVFDFMFAERAEDWI